MINCQSCRTENSDGTKYCINCGNDLTIQPVPSPSTAQGPRTGAPQTQRTGGPPLRPMANDNQPGMPRRGAQPIIKKGINVLALSAMVLGVLALLFIALMAPVFFRARAKSRNLAMPKTEKACQESCMSNQIKIVRAALLYASEQNEILPAGWGNVTVQPNFLICPSQKNNTVTNSYGFNSLMAGNALGQIPDPQHTIFVADCSATDNLIASEGHIDRRHNGGFIAAFLDEHVETIPSGATVKLHLQ